MVIMSQNKKLERDIESTAASKLLVICVDRDDDVGKKAGITTPVVGRDSCINAAQRLALEDPEDADSNSIFYAVKTYEDLVSKGYNVQVVVVAGVEKRGVQADEKIVNEIKSVLQKFSANGAVIVSDGEDDEMVIPVIQNVIPVVSVQRVVMQVSRTIEHSYAVFGKFLKMVIYDKTYSKFFLGVPGILLLIGGIGTVVGYTAEIFAVLVSILGGAFYDLAYGMKKRETFSEEVLYELEKEVELREVYIEGSPLNSLDIKLGKQIITWGVADSLRVVDVLNPTDEREFGMTDLEDIRLPINMTKIDYYIGNLNMLVAEYG